MINRIFNALLGPATASSGSRTVSENWVTKKIEAIKRAKQEAELEAKRAAEERERERVAEYERQGRQVGEAVRNKIRNGFYEALNPYLEFVRESHLEQILRDVEAGTSIRFFLFVNAEGELRVPEDSSEIGIPIDINLGYEGRDYCDVNPTTTIVPENPLISIDQIPGPGNFVLHGYVGIRPFIYYNSELRSLVLKHLPEFEKSPTQTSFRVSTFNYKAIFDKWYESPDDGPSRSGFSYIVINLDATMKTIEVIGEKTLRLTQGDLKISGALEDAVVRAYLKPNKV